jgi:rubrerythrin
MQPTTLGPNMTGATLAPAALAAMTQATEELTPFQEIDTSEMESQKLAYIEDSDAVGSIPVPTSLKGMAKSGMSKLKGKHPGVFLDKLGERLAYERTGARLYDALILKFNAAAQMAKGEVLPTILIEGDDGQARAPEPAAQLLHRIRSEELQHFQLLSDAIVAMGGDPTSQTPCADVTALASSGFMQVLNDPRTTLAQCLNAMLAVELADNAGWELLASLADDMGESDLAGQFLGALAQEQEHLVIVKQWLTGLVYEDPKPAAI